jgi:hypothetical protein
MSAGDEFAGHGIRRVWFADGVPDETVYMSLRCPACAKMHLVNRSGRTLMPRMPA